MNEWTSASDFEVSIEKLKRFWSPGTDQILVELIKSGDRIFHSEVHKLTNSILNKEELPEEWKELIIVIDYKMCDKTIIVYAYHFCQLHTKFYPTSCCQV